MGQHFGKDGMCVVMETGNVRHLWSLKGGSIWLRRGARSGEVGKEQGATQGPADQPSFFIPGSIRAQRGTDESFGLGSMYDFLSV